jgi:IPT/TIG domain
MRRNLSAPKPSPTRPTVAAFILIFLIIVVLGGITTVSIIFPDLNFPYTEIIIGLVIIFGVSVLILLLFILATVFNNLGLRDKNEALGLPRGTVRAIIALLLILVWVFVSLFLIINIPTLARLVSAPASSAANTANATATAASATANTANATATAANALPTPATATAANATAIAANATAIAANATAANATTASTATVSAVTDSTRLAQEFYATMSTLVVAVVGFYFGSKVNAPAAGAPATPSISDVAPKTGTPGQIISPFTIMGDNFGKMPDRVRLVLGGNPPIEGTDVKLVSTSQITCTIVLGIPQAEGKYDVVITIDGTEYIKSQAFEVTA